MIRWFLVFSAFSVGCVHSTLDADFRALRTEPYIGDTCTSVAIEWDRNVNASPTVVSISPRGRCTVAVGAHWVNERQDTPPTAYGVPRGR